MQMLGLVLLFSFGSVFISAVLGQDLDCSANDPPEFTKWVDEGCDENEKKIVECSEGYKMTVSPTCGKWNETVQCVKDFCAPYPCLNGGTCINGQNNYTCHCAGEWKGETCGICYSFNKTAGYQIQQFGYEFEANLTECESHCAANPKCLVYDHGFSKGVGYCYEHKSPLSEMTTEAKADCNIGEKIC